LKIYTIPNFLTLGNLICGILGIIFVLEGNSFLGSMMIFGSLLLDFLDGFIARLLNSSSEIGKQLDSLADVVSFGVLPSLIIFKILENLNAPDSYIPYLALILAAASALRLAKFNIDTRQSESFIGLPTPANGMVVGSFPLLISQSHWASPYIQNTSFLIFYVFLFSFLLNSEIYLIALKFKDFSIKKNKPKYILGAVSFILILLLQFAAIPAIIIFYVLLSWLTNKK
jgi:CDP-diacylglycerol--serine O-phosphatidyltransferase